jgi:predicted TIM-barrel fold metal-dependent hydrolase
MTAVPASTILGIAHAPSGLTPPAGSTDCHTHVFGPAARFPWSLERVYTPADASPEDLERLLAHLGLERVVIVQPSPYGTDNACTLEAVRRLGNRARAVAVIGADTPAAVLAEMHRAGVRGVRANLATLGIREPEAAWRAIDGLARRVAPLGWHVQTFTSLAVIAALAARLARLPVPLVVDHFGGAEGALGPGQPGFDQLLALVGGGQAYVKLSAGYRVSTQPDWADAAPLARALIAANPERVVWGSDWPHPIGARRAGADRDAIEPFHQVDDGLALRRLAAWAGDALTLRRILVDNPARLYDF